MNASFTNLVWSSVRIGGSTSSFFIIAPIVSVTTMRWRATMVAGERPWAMRRRATCSARSGDGWERRGREAIEVEGRELASQARLDERQRD